MSNGGRQIVCWGVLQGTNAKTATVALWKIHWHYFTTPGFFRVTSGLLAVGNNVVIRQCHIRTC